MHHRAAGVIEIGGRAVAPVRRTTTAALRRVGATRIDPALLVALGWTVVAAVVLVVGGVPTGLIVGFWVLGLVGPVTAAVAGLLRRRSQPEMPAPPNGTARIILPSSLRSPGARERS